MLSLWALMAFTALLMLELHQHAESSATLHTLAKQILGQKGKWVASFAMLFLFYSLFNGKERTDVEEYCVSEGWVKIASPKAKDRFGNPMLIKLKGEVEAYYV